MSFLKDKVTETANNRGNRQGNAGDDLYFWWDRVDRVEFNEYTEATEPEDNVIRILSITGEGCRIQFRAHTALKRGNKPRNLLATAFVSKEDLKLILAKMEEKEV